MTDRVRQRIEVAILAILFGAGAGWGAFEVRLGVVAEKVDRIDARITEMYCADKPPGCR